MVPAWLRKIHGNSSPKGSLQKLRSHHSAMHSGTECQHDCCPWTFEAACKTQRGYWTLRSKIVWALHRLSATFAHTSTPHLWSFPCQWVRWPKQLCPRMPLSWDASYRDLQDFDPSHPSTQTLLSSSKAPLHDRPPMIVWIAPPFLPSHLVAIQTWLAEPDYHQAVPSVWQFELQKKASGNTNIYESLVLSEAKQNWWHCVSVQTVPIILSSAVDET